MMHGIFENSLWDHLLSGKKKLFHYVWFIHTPPKIPDKLNYPTNPKNLTNPSSDNLLSLKVWISFESKCLGDEMFLLADAKNFSVSFRNCNRCHIGGLQ